MEADCRPCISNSWQAVEMAGGLPGCPIIDSECCMDCEVMLLVLLMLPQWLQAYSMHDNQKACLMDAMTLLRHLSLCQPIISGRHFFLYRSFSSHQSRPIQVHACRLARICCRRMWHITPANGWRCLRVTPRASYALAFGKLLKAIGSVLGYHCGVQVYRARIAALEKRAILGET